jgi:parvulin-like peptidyl-prolyl isomerase
MAKRKSRAEEQPRQITRKEHHLRAADRRRNRRLMIGSGIALGVALLFVAFGLVSEFAIRPNSAAATVNGTKIVTKEFWKRTYLEQNRLQNQLLRMTQLESQFGGQGFFTAQINQIQATLSSPFTLGIDVLDTMINEEVVRQQAASRGITVTAEEIEEALREEVAAGQGAVTAPQATATAEAGVTATAEAAAWTPTPTPTVDVSSTITVTATPVPTPVPPTPLPILGDDQYTEGLASLEENLKQVADMTLDDYREIVEARLLGEKLAAQIGEEQVAATEEQVQARHILLRVSTPEPTPEPVGEGTPTPEPTFTPTPLPEGFPTPEPTPTPRDDVATLALANELRQRVVAGEDFATLAQEYSEDTGSAINGGDLGWFGRGAMVAPFEEAAFGLEIGQVSEPIKTDFGYHLIEVTAKDPARPKEPATLEQERAQAYQTWLQEQVAATPIERPSDMLAMLPRNLEPLVPVSTTPVSQ